MKAEKEPDKDNSSKENKPYERPKIVTYTEDEILDLIGPVNTAGSPCFGVFAGLGPGPIHSSGHGGHRRH
jgi:hypothetical protein